MTVEPRTPRWALWDFEGQKWDEVPAENTPGEWYGDHDYGDWAAVLVREARAAALREVAEICDRGSTAMDGQFTLERDDAWALFAILTEATGGTE